METIEETYLPLRGAVGSLSKMSAQIEFPCAWGVESHLCLKLQNYSACLTVLFKGHVLTLRCSPLKTPKAYIVRLFIFIQRTVMSLLCVVLHSKHQKHISCDYSFSAQQLFLSHCTQGLHI